MIRPENAVESRVLMMALDIFINTTEDLIGDPDYNQGDLHEDLIAARKLQKELPS